MPIPLMLTEKGERAKVQNEILDEEQNAAPPIRIWLPGRPGSFVTPVSWLLSLGEGASLPRTQSTNLSALRDDERCEAPKRDERSRFALRRLGA